MGSWCLNCGQHRLHLSELPALGTKDRTGTLHFHLPLITDGLGGADSCCHLISSIVDCEIKESTDKNLLGEAMLVKIDKGMEKPQG